MKYLITIALTTFLASTSYAKTCTYKIVEGTEKITWTGFKFTNKTAVSGSFKTVKFEQNVHAQSLNELIKSITFSIDSSSVDTGNPARDMTLSKSIFGFLQVPDKITGKFLSATEGSVKSEIVLNKVTPVEFAFEKTDNKITLSGSVDLLENGLKKSYDALHNACKGLHTGEDKVAKTWSTADIKVEANYEEKCSKGLMDSIKDWFS